MKEVGLFDWLSSISETKVDLTEQQPDFKTYIAYQINRGLAQHKDTIMLANEMNKYSFLDPEMQYQFYLNLVAARARRGKWVKSSLPEEDVKFLAEHYKISLTKAEEYCKILTSEQINEIREGYNTGG